MLSIKRVLLSITGIFIVSVGHLYAQVPLKPRLDSFFNYLCTHQMDIGSVAIYKGDKAIYTRNFGSVGLRPADNENKPLLYQIGSITKLFTATLIYQLVDQHKLSLSEHLATYFPEIPKSDSITIEQMLAHTSGLGDYLQKDNAPSIWICSPIKPSEIMQEIITQGVNFSPGSKVEYSNSGYYLLAAILEKIYRQDYGTIVEEKIIKPLKLKHTASIKKADTTKVQKSYFYNGETWNKELDIFFPNVIGVGDMVSTPDDLHQFILALFHKNLVSKESLAHMLPQTGQTEGSGMESFSFGQHMFFGHSGDTFGTHSVMGYKPNDSLSVIYMVNGQWLPINDMAIGLFSILYQRDFVYPIPHSLKVSIDTLNAYCGVYTEQEAGKQISISKSGKMQQVIIDDQFPLLFEPNSTGGFTYTESGVSVKLSLQGSKLTLAQDGEAIYFFK